MLHRYTLHRIEEEEEEEQEEEQEEEDAFSNAGRLINAERLAVAFINYHGPIPHRWVLRDI